MIFSSSILKPEVRTAILQSGRDDKSAWIASTPFVLMVHIADEPPIFFMNLQAVEELLLPIKDSPAIGRARKNLIVVEGKVISSPAGLQLESVQENVGRVYRFESEPNVAQIFTPNFQHVWELLIYLDLGY